LLVSGLAVGVLASAGSAQALTKTVFAGAAGPAKGVFGRNTPASANAFSLKQVTVHVGDSVRWQFHGFHTVTFNVKGGADIPLDKPDTATYTGFLDPAGKPFWFNGQPRRFFNPDGAFPQGGKNEDGSKLTGSGLPLGSGPPKPFVLKFTKAGVFKYECVVHPGMEASVKVVRKGLRIPSDKDDRKATAKRLAQQAALARQLESFKPPANTTTVSGGHDADQVAILKFFPETMHVPVGGTVTFSVTTKLEPHTFTFGPAALRKQVSDGFVIPVPNPAGPPTLVFNPLATLPSDPPPALPPYDGTAHGNGFFNTGVLQSEHAAPPPATSQITFTKAGTFEFQCMIHGEMKGTVVVS
jgi:plastocyanin